MKSLSVGFARFVNALPVFVHVFFAVFLVMGFALANCYVCVGGFACSYGVLLHGGYWGLLYGVTYVYGRGYAWRVLLFSIVAFLFFVLFSWGVLHVFPAVDTSMAKIALWEARFPWEVLAVFGVSFAVYGLVEGILVCNGGYGYLFFHMVLNVFWQVVGCLFMFLPLGNVLGLLLGYGVVLVVLLLAFCVGVSMERVVVVIEGRYQGLVLFFCMAYLMTHLLVVKHVSFLGYSVTASLFVYALTFVCTDVLSELYGVAYTMLVIWCGLLTNMVLMVVVFCCHGFRVCAFLPVADGLFYESFSFVEITVVASMITYVVAQCLDVYLFDFLRVRTQGRYLWLRNNVGTVVSQWVDTVLFAVLAWGLRLVFSAVDGLSWDVWWRLSMHEFFGKMVLALCDTPLVYLLLFLLRNRSCLQRGK